MFRDRRAGTSVSSDFRIILLAISPHPTMSLPSAAAHEVGLESSTETLPADEKLAWGPKSVNVTPTQRESLLDTFPFTCDELDHLIASYSQFQPKIKLLSVLLQTSLNVKISNIDSETNQHIERVRYAETTFLPEESNRFLDLASGVAFVIGNNDSVDEGLYIYLETISILVGRRSSRSLISVLYQLATGPSKEGPSADTRCSPANLAGLIYRLILAAHYIETGRPNAMRPPPTAWVRSLREYAKASEGLSEAQFTTWVNSLAPQTDKTISTFCHCALFRPMHVFPATHPSIEFPLVDQECALWSDTFQTVPSSIALLSPQLGGKWIRQYSSDFDGCSFSAFQQALLEYQGPNVILIQSKSGDAFGFYTNEAWKESQNWFGRGGDSFLFGLKPSLQYYGPCGGDKPYSMFLHNPVSYRPGNLYGLCIGGVAETSPRLHITPTFEGCKAQSIDKVYDTGPLLSNHELYFDVDVIEVWAVNVDADSYLKALERGHRLADSREARRLNLAKVDRRQFLEDFQQGIFGASLFEHRQQTRGRHSFVADDKDGMGYYLADKPRSPITKNGNTKDVNSGSKVSK